VSKSKGILVGSNGSSPKAERTNEQAGGGRDGREQETRRASEASTERRGRVQETTGALRERQAFAGGNRFSKESAQSFSIDFRTPKPN
jgi:hypothetical protein